MSQSPMSANDLSGVGSGRDRRVLALAALAGVLALGLVAYFLLFSGGSGSGSSFKPIAKGGPASAAPVSPPASAQPSTVVVPAAYAAPLGRDPFKPLVTVTPLPTPKAPKTSSATPSPSATLPVIVIPTLTLSGNPGPAPTVTVTSSPTGLPTGSGPQTLTLVSVNYAASTANVTVTNSSGTTSFAPHTGTIFGTYFKLDSVLTDSAPTPTYSADFQYGDQFVQLSTGQSAQLGS